MAKQKNADEESGQAPGPKEVVFLHGEIKTPPFSAEARREAGSLIRRLQDRQSFGMPHLR
jgi:hypothetical protein